MKGFTLLELLAVIVILAIMLLIAIPMISNLIENSKKSALESSAKMIEKAIDLDYTLSEIEGLKEKIIYTFEEGVQTSTVAERVLKLNGGEPKNGKIIVTANGSVNLAIHDGTYCSYTLNEELKTEELTKDDCLKKASGVLYINNPTEANYPVNATPCTSEGVEFTHIIDERDSKTYAVTKIGNQCWFVDNLAYMTPACSSATWDSTSPHNACRINGGIAWDKDEVLYQWETLMNGSTNERAQGLCPFEFHLPSDSEWKVLEMNLGMTQVEVDILDAWRGTDQGQKMKSNKPGWNGTDYVGFNGKLAGTRNGISTLGLVDSNGYWWTSTESSTNALRRGLNNTDTIVLRSANPKMLGFSARCIFGE